MNTPKPKCDRIGGCFYEMGMTGPCKCDTLTPTQTVHPGELIRHQMPDGLGWCVSAAEHEHYVAKLRREIAECRQAFEIMELAVKRRDEKLAMLEPQMECLRLIRALMGYVENGSEQAVKLFQDDATKAYFVTTGSTRNPRSYFGSSLEEAIDKAWEAECKAWEEEQR